MGLGKSYINNKVAVMQPYFFPYIGYFQLVGASDYFVFYDDVNFIKNGWINRNKIWVNGKENNIVVPCIDISSFKKINETEISLKSNFSKKLIKTISQNYSKSPFYKDVMPIVEDVICSDKRLISELTETSIMSVSDYLGLETKFYKSSDDFVDTREFDRSDRLIQICKKLNSSEYINPIGGAILYDKTYFKEKGIDLSFIQPKSNIQYERGNQHDFPANLSIIDVLMYNSIDEVKRILKLYELR